MVVFLGVVTGTMLGVVVLGFVAGAIFVDEIARRNAAAHTLVESTF